MNPKFYYYQKIILLHVLVLSLIFYSCNKDEGKSLDFNDYPNMKIGFTTQNFKLAMPNSIDNLTEIILFASKEGFDFIELRDDFARLSSSECKTIAETARIKDIEIIYEIQKNPLDTGFLNVFTKGLENVTYFKNPGILRAMISNSEFRMDPNKKGWTKEEFERLVKITDSCALIAKTKNIQFLIENSNEAFFGDGDTYFGISDFMRSTNHVGLQFDSGNPFINTSRIKAQPDKVERQLSTLGSRWVSSHLKTIGDFGGGMKPVLTENPLPVEIVIDLMGKQNVLYASLELASVKEKQECYKNHKKSIDFLINKGILK